MLNICFPAHQTPSGRGSTLKGKNLLQRRANSFLLEQIPFRGANHFIFGVDSFSESSKPILTDLLPQKVYPYILYIQALLSHKVLSVLLKLNKSKLISHLVQWKEEIFVTILGSFLLFLHNSAPARL